jgi:hypothetical protein
VQVDDSAYLKSLKPNEKQARDASLIRPYVRARETDLFHGTTLAATAVFELRRANVSSPDSKETAYRGHGLELVKKSGSGSSTQN